LVLTIDDCFAAGAFLCVAQDVVSVVHATVTKVDHGTKTVVVKTADGTEHAIKVTGQTTYKGTKEGFDGLKEGTEVVVHETGKGAKETGLEIGKISKDGVKSPRERLSKWITAQRPSL
jgi:hypothetical protein